MWLLWKQLFSQFLTEATGADGIPSKVLKISAPYVSPVVTKLFNYSIQIGQFPVAWKAVKVSPLCKGDSKSDRDTYGPISVLPCVSKVFDSFLNADLQAFACDLGLIGQHVHQLDNEEKVVCAFLDIRKAFDVIDHNSIINLSIPVLVPLAKNWIGSGVIFRLMWRHPALFPKDLLCSLPIQGSVLGPTLFNKKHKLTIHCLSP